MAFASSLAVNFGRVASFIQVLFYLPLALDIAGQDAFLALSASLASYYLFLSTARLLTRGTRLAWIGQTLAVFQFIVIPACLLVCFNVYSPPSATIFPARRSDSQDKTASEAISSLFSRRSNGARREHIDLDHLDSLTGSEFLDRLVSASVAFFFWLARRVPGWWHTLLRISSPFFSLLEGVASLLVIQSLASTSRWIIASSLAAPSPRHQRANANGATTARGAAWMSNTFIMRSLASIGFGASEVWQIFFLLLSATIYVTAAFALYVSFDGATKDRPGTAAAIATSVTSTLWLTAITFAIRKGNVIETSLMFAYVVFNIYQLGPSLSFTPDPISLIRSFKVDTHGRVFVEKLPRSLQAPLTSKILQAASGLIEVIAHWLGQSVDFIHAAGAALPKSVIVSLIYRLMVLYAASRILPMLKGSVAPKHDDEQNHARRASWGRARSKRGGGDQDRESESEYSGSSSDSSSHSSSSSLSGTEVEELEEQVWDEDEGRRILQRRRLRRRTRRRTPFDGELEESESDTGSGEYSEDDSGIAYNDDGTKSIADELKEPMSLADTLKSPPPPPSTALKGSKRARKNPNVGRTKPTRRPSTTVTSPKVKATDLPPTTRKRPNLSRPPSESGRHKRPRPPPSSSSFPPSPASRSSRGQEGEAFGSFISILVSYSRLILIAVYSHLLLLDQKNQIYWRFLTVGLTLFLWGLEIVISKEEEVAVGGVGELGAAGAVGRG
ncbi:related to ICE2 - integral ER membrane protein with type-III transmembrane domains [Ustilago sp. UG-2017a]|nr:related to ICE2 - integral ER membrane protein with type-III transmembrane domains [Ustilago sp. UG-2017a]